MSPPDRPDAQRLIASLPIAVLLLAPDRTVAAVNPAAEQLLGQGAQRFSGRFVGTLVSFVEPRLDEQLDQGDAQVFARDALVRIAGAPPRRLDVMLAPVAHHPGWQMLALHETIGVEALGGEGPSGALTSPLRAPAVLAHEIKNPLAGIRGAAQLLARSAQGADLALTELITGEVHRIAALVDRMQSLGRRHREPAGPCNLHEAVRRAQAVAQASPGWPSTIEESFDPSLPPVLCNADALVQVVLNLLVNAREACGERPEPRIVVRTRFASGIRLHGERGETSVPLPIELRVSDNGPGVDPALREHIFEPFVSGKPAGQGLGLALVQKLAHEMNGRITHDREDATGLTHFRLHLPVAAKTVAAKRAAA
ncbi:MAG TPA: ATP-binding protein [Novosphingobium sp.]|nr:ATP-binding protein [Novosphingobium sp.]